MLLLICACRFPVVHPSVKLFIGLTGKKEFCFTKQIMISAFGISFVGMKLRPS